MKLRFVILAVVAALILFGTPTVLIIASGELAPADDEVLSVLTLINEDSAEDPYTRLALQGVYSAYHNYPGMRADLYGYDTSRKEEMKDYSDFISKEGYDIVVQVGSEPIIPPDIAYLLFPKIQFIYFDSNYQYDNKWENVTLVEFRSNEAAFIAGYEAGMITNTNIVGFLAGNDSPAIDSLKYGFEAGVKYAGEDRGVPIKLLTSTINSYTDQVLAYNKTEELLKEGADVVMTAAGYAGIGGIFAAVINNSYAIGVDDNESYVAPDHVLCSVTKNLEGVLKTYLLNAAMEKARIGSFEVGQVIPVGLVSLGFKEDAVDVTGLHSVIENQVQKINNFKQYIKSGIIPVPNSAETMKNWSVATIKENQAILLKNGRLLEINENDS